MQENATSSFKNWRKSDIRRKKGNMPYITSIWVPGPSQAIQFIVFGPWVELGEVV